LQEKKRNVYTKEKNIFGKKLGLRLGGNWLDNVLINYHVGIKSMWSYTPNPTIFHGEVLIFG